MSAAAIFLVLLLACLASVQGKPYTSDYQKKLELLTSVIQNDGQWAHVLQQTIRFKPELKHYGRLVQNELLSATIEDEFLNPHSFLKNIFRSGLYRIGHVLDLGILAVQRAFKCRSFKHVSHLLHLIHVEISHHIQQDTAVKRTGKAKRLVATVLAKMTGLLFAENLIIEAVAFLDMYEYNELRYNVNRFTFLPIIKILTSKMQDEITGACKIHDRELYAAELSLTVNTGIYNAVTTRSIRKQDLKIMFESSLSHIEEDFQLLPVKSISMKSWQDLLEFVPKVDEKKRIRKP